MSIEVLSEVWGSLLGQPTGRPRFAARCLHTKIATPVPMPMQPSASGTAIAAHTLTKLAELLNVEPPAFLSSNPLRLRPITVEETIYPYRNAQGDLVFEVVRRSEGR